MNINQIFDIDSSEPIDESLFLELVPDYGRALYHNLDMALELLESLANGNEDDVEMSRKSQIFGTALDEARMDSENGRKRGVEFIESMELKLENLSNDNEVASYGGLMLSQCWTQVGLTPPKSLLNSNDKITKALSTFASDAPQAVTSIREIIESPIDLKDQDSLQKLVGIYTAFLPTLPDSFQYAMVRDAVACKSEKYADLGCSLLLLNNQSVQSAVIDGFSDRLKSGLLYSSTVAKLTTMRSWLSDNSTISQIDQLVKEAMKQGLKVSNDKSKIRYHKMISSWVDGVGAQTVAAAVQNGNSRHVAMLLLKQGRGVQDVIMIPCDSANKQRATIDEVGSIMPDGGAVDVSIEFLYQVVKIALHDGYQNGIKPSPGLVEFAQVMGLSDIRPSTGAIEEILSVIDPDGRITGKSNEELESLVADSEFWDEKFKILSNWFENSDEVDNVLRNGRPEEELWSILEKRREHWTMCIARTALLLHEADSEELDSFIAVLKFMTSGMDLKKIPVMDMIVGETIFCWETENSLQYEEK